MINRLKKQTHKQTNKQTNKKIKITVIDVVNINITNIFNLTNYRAP